MRPLPMPGSALPDHLLHDHDTTLGDDLAADLQAALLEPVEATR